MHHPMPEITAAHILAALSPTAPASVVIAVTHDEQRVLVCPITDTTDWRSRETAAVVATRTELEAALSPDQHRDIAAIDALAEDLTDHAAVMLDLLDGAMARVQGSTPFGAVLDATCDRLVDGALFAAIAWWGFVVVDNPRIGVAALLCLVLAQVISYVKARAEASGFGDVANGGLIERAERLIITLVGTGLTGLGLPYAVEVSQWLLAEVQSIRVHELSKRIDRLSAEDKEALMAAVPALEALLEDDERRN